jgi:hypothetical protein
MNARQILFILGCFIHQIVFAEDVQLLLVPPSNVLIRGIVTIEAEVVPRTKLTPITIFVDGLKHCWDVGKVSCKWDTNKEISGNHIISAITSIEEKSVTAMSTVFVFSDFKSASVLKKSSCCVNIK